METLQTSPTSAKSSIWKKLAIAIGIITATFIALGIYGSKDLATDEAAIKAETEQILSQLKNSQIDELYADAHSELLEVTTKADVENFAKLFPAITKYTSITFKNIQHDTTDATVTGQLTIENADPLNFSIDLGKENGSWKLIFFDLKGSTEMLEKNDLGINDTATIRTLIVGSKYNEDGTTIAETVIAPETEIIYASVIAENQTLERISAEVKLYRIDTGQEIIAILPIQKSSNGLSSAIRSTFTKNTEKWPIGNYKIIATLANGQTKEQEFEIK